MAEVVLVADDDACFRAFLRAVLEDGGYRVRDAEDGASALAATRETRPAAVVLDVNMPRLNGYEICRALREDHGWDLPILFVSGDRTESFDKVAGLLIGGDDYLVKPVAGDELLARLRVLLRRGSTSAPPAAVNLTPRELEVLRLLAEGCNQEEIANRLVISRKTVGTHIERILSKLGVHSRAAAVSLAYRLRLVPVPA